MDDQLELLKKQAEDAQVRAKAARAKANELAQKSERLSRKMPQAQDQSSCGHLAEYSYSSGGTLPSYPLSYLEMDMMLNPWKYEPSNWHPVDTSLWPYIRNYDGSY